MKLRNGNSSTRTKGLSAVTLIECLVYIAVSSTILGVATGALFHCYDHMRSLHRNSNDISRVLRIGEQWRNDVRLASQPPTPDAAGLTLHIPHTNGVVEYRFSDNALLRRAVADGPWSTVLTNLNQSTMRLEPQRGVAAWRWEMELKPLRKPARVRPLFTFTAVPESRFTP
jgi:hypothetical protein